MEPIRVGVIGVGAFGESHLVAYKSLPYVEVTAVCDANIERVDEISARYGIANRYTDYHRMLDEGALDVVSVCTTEDAHREPTLAAIAAGKHVLVEKPIATRLEDAQAMIAAAHAAGIHLMPGHIMRFETRHALVKERIAAGELGKVVAVSARRNRPVSQAQTYLRTHGILATGVHDIDILLWYVAARVKRVHAVSRNIHGTAHADATWALLEFENGSVASLENLWLNPDHGGIAANDAMQVTGTRGIANIDFVNTGLSFWQENGYSVPDTSHEPRIRGEVLGALKEELAYFTRRVLEHRTPDVVSLEDAVHALEIALAIVKSAATGQVELLEVK